jgi:hypothetical protein
MHLAVRVFGATPTSRKMAQSVDHMLEGGRGESNQLFAVRAADLCKDGDPTCSDGPNPFGRKGVRVTQGQPQHREAIAPGHLPAFFV